MVLLATTIPITTTIHIRVHPTLAIMFQAVGTNCDWLILINPNLKILARNMAWHKMRSFF